MGTRDGLSLMEQEKLGRQKWFLTSQRPFLLSSFFCPPRFAPLRIDLLHGLVPVILAASALLLAGFACRAISLSL